MSTQEEKADKIEDAMETIKWAADAHDKLYPSHNEDVPEALLTLEDAVTVPRSDYDALLARAERGERALWELMRGKGYPNDGDAILAGRWMEDIGFVRLTAPDEKTNTAFVWTPAAHEYAKSMQEGGNET